MRGARIYLTTCESNDVGGARLKSPNASPMIGEISFKPTWQEYSDHQPESKRIGMHHDHRSLSPAPVLRLLRAAYNPVSVAFTHITRCPKLHGEGDGFTHTKTETFPTPPNLQFSSITITTISQIIISTIVATTTARLIAIITATYT